MLVIHIISRKFKSSLELEFDVEVPYFDLISRIHILNKMLRINFFDQMLRIHISNLMLSIHILNLMLRIHIFNLMPNFHILNLFFNQRLLQDIRLNPFKSCFFFVFEDLTEPLASEEKHRKTFEILVCR